MITLLLLLGTIAQAKDVFDYCIPSNSTCWPSDTQWGELKAKITGSKLHAIGDSNQYMSQCSATGALAAYGLLNNGQGRCMQYQSCSKAKCEVGGAWNIPEYSVEASTESDVVEAIKFANEHNIQVTVKTTGHNYAGASMGDGTLLIWMRNYEKYLNITDNYTLCGQTYYAAIKVGGGQVWEEVYKATGNNYHIIGGGGLTVSAAGGWLMGGGLSASARQYGMGVDQVLQFNIVKADGTAATASQCENEDLFWALRGGGGGSFGVVTSVVYKLHETKPFCEMYFYATDFSEHTNWDSKTVVKWIEYWVDTAPSLDRRWGGYWTFSYGILYFEGTQAELNNDTFYTNLKAMDNMEISVKCKQSYFAVRGGPDDLVTDETGQASLNIASRLISIDEAKNNPQKLQNTFYTMLSLGFHTFNYVLGGAMMDVAVNATSVHPAMRTAIFQMETFDERMIQKLREEYPDSGAGFNHAARNEPDWKNQFWGTNLAKLQGLKKEYDPDNRFNCWHCVGYLSAGGDVVLPSLILILISMAVYFMN